MHYATYTVVELLPDAVTAQLQPGTLTMLLHPHTSKLLTCNGVPFMVTRLDPPHMWLHSLMHTVELKENVCCIRHLGSPSLVAMVLKPYFC